MTQISPHIVHPHAALTELLSGRYTGHSVNEVRLSIEVFYGPFPLLFEVPQQPNHGHQGPGMVLTGLSEMPGEMGRRNSGIPFIGASVMGYCPAVGHEGAAVRNVATIKGERWDEFVKPEAAIDPRVGSQPDELKRTAGEIEERA